MIIGPKLKIKYFSKCMLKLEINGHQYVLISLEGQIIVLRTTFILQWERAWEKLVATFKALNEKKKTYKNIAKWNIK